MSKCRYDLSEDCHNKDCLTCVLDKIRAEIAEYKDDKIIHAERNEMLEIVLEIIDKYNIERSDKE